MWRGGCIIRSVFLGKIKEAFDNNPELNNLVLDPYFKDKLEDAQESWRRVVATAVSNGIPVPASPLHWPISTDTVVSVYLLIFCRLNAIILGHIPMKNR
jgi:6-phosphogluconate dehydrogenase